MRILIVVHQFMPRHHAGTEVVARDAGLELRRRGHDVHVLTTEFGAPREGGRIGGRTYDHRGLKVHAVEIPRPPTVVEALGGEYGTDAVADHVRHYVERLQPEVIHAFHLARFGAAVVDVLAAQEAPLVYTATDFWSICTRSILMKPSGELCSGPDDISSNCLECRYAERLVPRNVPTGKARRRAMYRRLAERALDERIGEHPNMASLRLMLGRTEHVRERINSVDAILAPTRVMANMLIANGIRRELVRHSPYGLDLAPYREVARRREPSDAVRFGYVGTLREPKGVDVLLRAVERLPRTYDMTLRVVGDLRESPAYARALFERARDDPRINFTGMVPNERTAEQLAEIDVLVVPSRWSENSPTTILAALAAGTPALASNVAGIAEIVRHGENGLLFENGDPAELNDRMRSLLDDRALLARLQANAVGLRTVEDSVDETLALYDALRREVASVPRASAAVTVAADAGREDQRADQPPTGPVRESGSSPRAPAGPPRSGGNGRTSLADLRPRLRRIAGPRRRGRRSAPEPVERPPFLITGRARSGTSWVMRILDSHPEILCRGEGRFYGAKYRVGDTDVRSLHGALLASKPVRAWAESSGWTRGRDTRDVLSEMAATLAEQLLARELARSGKRLAGDKTPLTAPTMLREVATLQPGTKVAHVIRDGRDVAVSTVHHVWNSDLREGGFHRLTKGQLRVREEYRADPEGFLASGRSLFAEGVLASTARDWARLVRGAMRDGRRHLGADYLELRFEALLERGPREVARLLEFLGAGADPRTVRRCLAAARFERTSGGRPRGDEDSESAIRLGVAGDWSRVFTAMDRRIFKEAAGDLLIELGYERDGRW